MTSFYNACMVRALLKISLLFLLFLGLTGCATFSRPISPPQNRTISWEKREATLSTINAWDMNGLIAVRIPEDAWTANLRWQQRQQYYALSLWGPLGTHSLLLTGNPERVILKTGEGKTYEASSPEALLAERTGWILPVSHLFYWIRGLPVPDMSAQTQFDAYHHLTLLTQAGWTIHYLGYGSVKHIDLPTKIYITHPPIQLKIVIHQWQFSNSH